MKIIKESSNPRGDMDKDLFSWNQHIPITDLKAKNSLHTTQISRFKYIFIIIK